MDDPGGLATIEAIRDVGARIAAYQQVVANHPNHAYAWSNLAVDQKANRDYVAARRSILRALAVSAELRAAVPEAARDLARIGRYALREELLVTPSQVIYAATDTESNEPIMLRALLDCEAHQAIELFGSHEGRTRLDDLPRLAKALAIARAAESTPFQVLEPLRGRLVHHLIERDALDVDVAVDLVTRIAATVRELRKRRVHGIDLRPEYWMRSDDLDRGLIYLGPLAQRGGAAWQSPEERAGAPAGEAGDVYRLALLLHLAATGRPPPTMSATGERAIDRTPPERWPPRFQPLLGLVAQSVHATPSERPALEQWDEQLGAIRSARAVAPSSGGKRCGGYRLIRTLGEGKFGTVYEGVDDAGDRHAVKILHAQFANHGEMRLRFQNEARIASDTQHPGIVRVHEAGETEAGEHYYAMELIPGGALSDRLRRGVLAPRTTADIGIQVARALATVHGGAEPLVHRDLKPGNLLVAGENGDKITVKVCDFGIAKLLGDPTEAGIPFTSTGRFLGTPRYMSPEQWQQVDVDRRADVYGLGAVLYECLVGEAPFVATNEYLLQQAHIHAPVPPLAARGVPPGLARIVERMLAKDRRDRYQTMDEVADELARWAEDAPTVIDGKVEPPAPAPPAPKPPDNTAPGGKPTPPTPTRWRRWLAPALAGLVIGGGVTTWLALRGSEPAKQPRVVVTPPPPGPVTPLARAVLPAANELHRSKGVVMELMFIGWSADDATFVIDVACVADDGTPYAFRHVIDTTTPDHGVVEAYRLVGDTAPSGGALLLRAWNEAQPSSAWSSPPRAIYDGNSAGELPLPTITVRGQVRYDRDDELVPLHHQPAPLMGYDAFTGKPAAQAITWGVAIESARTGDVLLARNKAAPFAEPDPAYRESADNRLLFSLANQPGLLFEYRSGFHRDDLAPADQNEQLLADAVVLFHWGKDRRRAVVTVNERSEPQPSKFLHTARWSLVELAP